MCMSNNLIEQFRLPDTANGSFRSNAYTWTGSDAIAEATRLIMKGEKVSLHVCETHMEDAGTLYTFTFWVDDSQMQGRDKEVRMYSNVHGGESALCEADPITVAAHMSAMLYRRAGEVGGCVYRQP